MNLFFWQHTRERRDYTPALRSPNPLRTPVIGLKPIKGVRRGFGGVI